MTCKKGETPATSANVTSAPNSSLQDNCSIAGGNCKALCHNISDALSEAQIKLEQARVVLNDQGNIFFADEAPETEQEMILIAFGYEDASVRNGIALEQVNAALSAVTEILADLEQKGRCQNG